MDLHLNLKGEYFDQIKAGIKKEEYRLYNSYWEKRLKNKSFDKIILKRGYPKKDDRSKVIKRPWHGYTVRVITHPHFGNEPVSVFAIRVNP